MNFKSLLLIGSMAAMGAAFTSCANENVYDGDFASKQANAEYEANFVKKYGAIDNKSWDLATNQAHYSLPSVASTRAITRGTTGEIKQEVGQMIVEKEVIQWVFNNMKAGVNNSLKGSPFYMVTVENSFTIVPIFQGTASFYWELWMSVEGEDDVLIWKKGDALSWRSENGSWTPAGTSNAGINKNAYEVQSPTIEFSDMPVGRKMWFYLKVWDSYQAYKSNNVNPRILSSLDRMMLGLEDIDRPKNVPEGNTVTVIGCEDNNKGGSDMDYEDLVFLMYGNPAPPIYHTDTVIVEKVKRYMMEDLGETDDFDFNDIVVDVAYDRVQKINYFKNTEDGGWEFDHDVVLGNLPQQATVRAAGGTLDFTLKIGNTTWKKGDKLDAISMLNTGLNGASIDFNAKLDEFTIAGFNPSENNISVAVEKRGGSGAVETIGFPKKGEAPKIIAVDASNEWMKERVSIPQSWFTE